MTDDRMSISDVKQFVDRHGGDVFDVGHVGSTTHVFADRLEHDAADFDMPSNVETEDWGPDSVVFDIDRKHEFSR